MQQFEAASPWTERRIVTVQNQPAMIARRETGRGPTMVLIHSVALDHTMWEPVLRHLDPDIDVLAYDVRNHGAADSTTAFNLEIGADDLAALIKTVGLDPVYPVGISMGGAIVQDFAVRHRQEAIGIAVISSAGKAGSAPNDRADAGLRDGLAAQVDTTLTRWFSPAFLAKDGPWVRYARDHILSWNPASWAAAWRALAGRDMLERLSTVTVPALCVAGDSDPSAPVAAVQAVADAIPNSTLSVLAGPHLLNLEAPHALAAELSRHYRAAVAQAA